MERLPRQEREAQLLEAFLTIASKIGIERVTLQKVADAAGVSFATVQAHFGGSPGKLTEKAVAYVGAEAQRYIAAALGEALLDPKSNLLEVYIRETFEWSRKKRPHSSFWVYYYYLCAGGSAFRGPNQKILELARGRVRSLLVDAIGKGQLPQGMKDLDALAVKIHTALAGGVVVALAEPARDAFKRQMELTLATARDLVAAHAR